MITLTQQKTYYDALVRRDPAFVGVFFAGVKSTGVFCHSVCPARKPKFENCEFFHSAEEALLASFRPCKRCRPLSPPDETPEMIRLLVEAVENKPEHRWKDADFREIGVDASTVRRQFKKRFGMTFVQYARARRMGIAMKEIRAGEKVIGAQLTVGYESESGFRDAFSRIMGAAPSTIEGENLTAAWLDTQLGPMIAIADEFELVLLEFANRRGLEREIERLRQKTKAAIIPGRTKPIDRIAEELAQYFNGDLLQFSTPLKLMGTPFQLEVWNALREIPVGETSTYSAIANKIGAPNAVRAVARANGANQLAIVVPCHRVFSANGDLTGYGGGLARKQWLLDHEKKMEENDK